MKLLYTIACLGVLAIAWGSFLIGSGILAGKLFYLFVGAVNIVMGIALLAGVVPEIYAQR